MEQEEGRRPRRRKAKKDITVKVNSGTVIRIVSVLLMIGIILFMMHGMK